MRQLIRETVLFIGCITIIPVFLLAVFYGKDTLVWEKDPGVEEYLAAQIIKDIPMEMNMETIKAQAVLTRSNVTKALREGELSFFDLKKEKSAAEKQLERKEFWTYYRKCQKVVEETAHQVLVYEGEVQYGPFHRMSAGKTRDGWEVMGRKEYFFCSQVDSQSDADEKDYAHTYIFTRQELVDIGNACWPGAGLTMESRPVDMKVIKKDGTGYVLQIQVGQMKIAGEEFRGRMGFASSCFEMEEKGDQIRFICHGIGHGLGLSQCGAQIMAKNGADYEKILEHYFPQMKLQKE